MLAENAAVASLDQGLNADVATLSIMLQLRGRKREKVVRTISVCARTPTHYICLWKGKSEKRDKIIVNSLQIKRIDNFLQINQSGPEINYNVKADLKFGFIPEAPEK